MNNPIGHGRVNALWPGVVQGNWEWYINGLNEPYLETDMPIVFDTGRGRRWPNPDISNSNRKLTNAYVKADHMFVKFFMYINN